MSEKPARFKFEVRSGLYAGVLNVLPAGTHVIGGGVDADIVFVDQGLAAHHVRVTLADDGIEVEALAPGVALEGIGEIAPGATLKAPLPATLHAGTMELNWSTENGDRAGTIPGSRFSVQTLGGIACGLLVLAAILMSLVYNATADARTAEAQQAAAEPPAAAKLMPNRLDASGTAAAAKALQAEVDKANLLNIRVTSGAGIVTAQGTIPPELTGDWQKVQQWFDHSYTGSLTLVNGVGVREEKLPSSIAVEAVWQGVQPHLLVRGQKYFEGAMLEDGWTIHKIEGDRVLLSREGRLAAVRF